MVEQIEEFGSEFNADSFGDVRPFEYGEIKVVDSGRTQRGVHARFGTVPPRRRGCKAIDIKPLGQAAAAPFAASGHNVWTYVADAEASTFQRSGGSSPGNLERKTALESGYAVDSPTGDDFVFNS